MQSTFQLGINHHLLFPDGMTDPVTHEATLRDLLAWPEFRVIDLYCAGDAAQRKRESALVRASGKLPVYNSPLLYTIPGCDPNATDAATIALTRQTVLPHLDAAAACGSALINIASGRNPEPRDRQRAWAGWLDFLAWFGGEAAARGLRVVIEPFDQSIGKNLLIGPTVDAVRSVEEMRRRQVASVGLMVDMAHVAILNETFAHAISLSRPYLWHVHLGNAVIRHPSHPWYGDFHPPLEIPEGEHDRTHLGAFLRELKTAGYFEGGKATLTLEMRPYPQTTARASVDRWMEMLKEVLPCV